MCTLCRLVYSCDTKPILTSSCWWSKPSLFITCTDCSLLVIWAFNSPMLLCSVSHFSLKSRTLLSRLDFCIRKFYINAVFCFTRYLVVWNTSVRHLMVRNGWPFRRVRPDISGLALSGSPAVVVSLWWRPVLSVTWWLHHYRS